MLFQPVPPAHRAPQEPPCHDVPGQGPTRVPVHYPWVILTYFRTHFVAGVNRICRTPVGTYDHMTARPQNWPEIDSRLGQPDFWLFVAMACIFLLMGGALISLLVSPQAPQQTAGLYLVAAMAAAFIGLSLLMTTALCLAALANRPFRHATDDVLPEVPREPLLESGQVSFAALTHRLEQSASAVRLIPIPDLYRRTRLVAFLWINLIAVVTTAFIWWSPPPAVAFAPSTALLTVGVFSAGNLSAWLFSFLIDRAKQQLPALEADLNANQCRINTAHAERSFVLSDVIAVQLCSARRILNLNQAGLQYFSALELNLVWTGSSPPSPGGAVLQRATLVNLRGQGHRAVPLARELADALGVPLLNHATPEHWKVEGRRSKARMPECDGGYM